MLGSALDRHERGLGIESVEDGLDQEQIDAAFEQRGGLFAVGGDQLVEAQRAIGGVVDARRERERLVGGSECSGDEARAIGGLLGLLVSGGARQARGREVHLVHVGFGCVVGLRDGGRRERVGLDDVGASFEEALVHGRDDLGASQRKDVVVADHRARMIAEAFPAERLFVERVALQGRAHGTVEHKDALGEQGAQARTNVGLRNGQAHWDAPFSSRVRALRVSLGSPRGTNAGSDERDEVRRLRIACGALYLNGFKARVLEQALELGLREAEVAMVVAFAHPVLGVR